MLNFPAAQFGDMAPKLNKSARLDDDGQEVPDEEGMAVDNAVPADDFDIEEAEDAPFNRADFIKAMRAEVQQQLTAALPGVISQAADNSFDRPSAMMQKLEARQAKQYRRLHELSGQLSAVQDQLTKMNVSLEKVAQERVGTPQPATSASPTSHPKTTTAASSSAPSACPTTPAEKYHIGTPRGPRVVVQQEADDEASVLVHWPHRVHKEHMKAIHSRMEAFYGDSLASDSHPTFPKGGTTYGIKFRSPRDAASFRTAFAQRPFHYSSADGVPETHLRIKPALPPDQRARETLLHPIFGLVNSGEMEGKVKTYFPKGSRPTTVLALAREDGALQDLAILEYTPGEVNVKFRSIVLSPLIAGNLETLAKIADLSGVRPTVMPDEAQDGQDLR